MSDSSVPIVLGMVAHPEFPSDAKGQLCDAISQIMLEFRRTFPKSPLVLLTSMTTDAERAAVAHVKSLNESQNLQCTVRPVISFSDAITADCCFDQLPLYLQTCFKEESFDWLGVPTRALATSADEKKLEADHAARRCVGAFIVRHCNVLIALWHGELGHEPDEPGRHIQVQLGSPIPSEYPTYRPLGSAAEVGPVYVIRGDRSDKSRDVPQADDLPDWSQWLPLRPREIGDRAGIEASKQLSLSRPVWSARLRESLAHQLGFVSVDAEWNIFRAACFAVEEFNTNVSTAASDTAEPAQPAKKDIRFALAQAITRHWAPAACETLSRLVAVRTAASKISSTNETSRLRSIRFAYWLAFLSAVCFHLYADLAFQDRHQLWLLIVSLGLLAVMGFVLLRAWFCAFDAKRIDARALAEGIRVRCWWGLCGVGVSVADSYLSQLRGEVSWVRQALLALSPQPEMWRWWFGHLTTQQQIEQLRDARIHWVDAQYSYYERQAGKNEKWARNYNLGGWSLIGLSWIVALVLAMSRHRSHPPDWALIAEGCSLVAGGLLLAFGKSVSHEELAKQYNRMQLVFSEAKVELDAILNGDGDDRVARSQEVLKALGRECITEHAQWLILRRSRPLEPPVA